MRHAPTALTLLLAATLAAPAHAKTWSKTWTVDGRPTVEITTNDAHVHLHPGPAGTVSARIIYEIQRWGWAGNVHEPEISLEQEGRTIRILARTRGLVVVFGGINEKFDVDVTVPADGDVSVHSGDGAIDASGLRGAISLEAGDGHIRASDLKGSLRLRTGDGAIDADALDGDLEARSGDGHLRVEGRFDALDLRTGDGRLDATLARGSQPRSDWSVASGDGSLTLRIPRNLQALLDAHTGDGNLHVNLPITVNGDLARHELRGSLNGGTVPVRVRTTDGALTLGVSE